jgi:hypothetical protein
VPARSLIGALINVDHVGGAFAVPVTAMLRMILSVERGVLQGFQQYRTVALIILGEAFLRIVFALCCSWRRGGGIRRQGSGPALRSAVCTGLV